MKRVIILMACFAINKLSIAQSDFEINFIRDVISSQVYPETDSLYWDKAEIKIFNINSANSIELKSYKFENGGFVQLYNSLNTLTSLPNNDCLITYCFYKLNNNVIIINLGKREIDNTHYKVFIKVNGKSGTQSISKEVEL